MELKPLVAAVVAAIGATATSFPACAAPRLQAVEFFAMNPPITAAQKADIYTDARVKYTWTGHKGKPVEHVYDLAYHQLLGTTDRLNDKVIGGLYDSMGNPLSDDYGQMASDAADGTSLIDVPGMEALNPDTARPLAMVVNFEYKDLPPASAGVLQSSHWSRLPAVIGVAKLDQDKRTGALYAVDYNRVDLGGVNGGWIHCGSTLSAWNTHIGSEEYEPDARVREILVSDTDFAINTNAKVNAIRAVGSDDATDIDSFSHYYFGTGTPHVPDRNAPGDATQGTIARSLTANPYHYGLLPEVTVHRDGRASVVKHYAPGRFAREMQEMASDDRTAIGGDDGKNTALFMFVADRPKDLSKGTLYAAKVTQTSAERGGSYVLQWIRLGHASDGEIKSLVDGGVTFSAIFEAHTSDPRDPSYAKVTTYMGTEWLRLKPGMEKAAAFLETRRYAALLGATTEFSKMEYIAYNDAERKFYLTISRVEAGMADEVGDIRVSRNDGGIILEMSTSRSQTDAAGAPIDSEYVGTSLTSIPELVGGWGWLGLDSSGNAFKDGEGNQCSQDRVCGPDNLRYVESIRTLFIGEDTSRRNNNYVWAYNVDTHKLSRILSVPMGAEATGLTIAPRQSGFAYITSNFQHPGEDKIKNYTGSDKMEVLTAIEAKWNGRRKAAIGYIGIKGAAGEKAALPAMK